MKLYIENFFFTRARAESYNQINNSVLDMYNGKVFLDMHK